MMSKYKKMLDYLVCPQCKTALALDAIESDSNGVKEGALNCRVCSVSYHISNYIPFLVLKPNKDRRQEGVAVDLKNAIKAYRKITDNDSFASGLSFDRDLQNRDLVFLDAGCGIGKNLVVLKKNGVNLALGFDLVPELLDIARESYGIKDVFIANARQIPLPDESVDRCLLYDTIEHCSDPDSVLRELYRVLRKDGVLYMNVPNARSVGDRIFRWGGILVYGKTSHIQKFTLKRIIKLLDEHGFLVESTKTGRGIFVDYPQLARFALVKKILTLLFSGEVSGWEFTLKKKR